VVGEGQTAEGTLVFTKNGGTVPLTMIGATMSLPRLMVSPGGGISSSPACGLLRSWDGWSLVGGIGGSSNPSRCMDAVHTVTLYHALRLAVYPTDLGILSYVQLSMWMVHIMMNEVWGAFGDPAMHVWNASLESSQSKIGSS
jgi:hypothetical protein